MVRALRKTGIICTIGPASRKSSVLKAMHDAGMNIARLNFSHGTHADHRKNIKTIRKLNKDYGLDLQILQDLEGFRIRIGEFSDDANGQMQLYGKQVVVLSNQNVKSVYPVIPLDYEGPLTAIKPGNIIYIDDDKIAEAQLYISKLFSSYYGIKGFCYKAEPVMSQRDVAKLMQMEL